MPVAQWGSVGLYPFWKQYANNGKSALLYHKFVRLSFFKLLYKENVIKRMS